MMEFTQVSTERWESNIQAYNAVALNSNREPVGTKSPRFIIEQKGNKYRVQEQHVGRKIILGRCNSLNKAIELAESFMR